MSRIDVMVDIETLGTDSDSTIFHIAAMAFDIRTGEPVEGLAVPHTYNETADIEANRNPLNIDGSTLKWWLRTDKDLLSDLLHKGDKSSELILWDFHSWLKTLSRDNNVYLWGNGILFDNKMLEYQMTKKLGLEYPIHFRNDRDLRTLLELASMKTGMSENEIRSKFNDSSLRAHDAMDDVTYQINLTVYCFNVLTGEGK